MSFHEERVDEDIMPEASSSSDESIHNFPPKISDATATFDPCRRKRLRSESLEPSGVFVKSNRSMKIQPPAFSDEPVTSYPFRGEMHELIRSVSSSASHYQTHIRQATQSCRNTQRTL
ncbi:hypothetical protein G5714_000133 [Onychostoma macrolepis]|uniref:Uncharacterized protein n=1 Tax=Onychostoma macrolepis TaxID=369639 RepID=A0A7J6DFK0_9TELE|nr:hypothetical protein G5714_000133 [Onychostoma macrolepis]